MPDTGYKRVPKSLDTDITKVSEEALKTHCFDLIHSPLI
ncbi:hypothetical protein LMG23994_05091 [Cupriavidus pinatubonensis]|uniref:Uncharacterized protein n=1 Tax=Cupriavidus pinatubonensis TaxID=248026 RepID=A0ABN7ZEV5_9BURK|nr:hypothetical protein LMG23994_05091 [Cupriavidus pinatubonensis]